MFNVVFDTQTRTVIIMEPPDASGIVDFDVQTDLYSNGKYQWLTDSSLNKFEFPVRAVGGDPLPGSKALGDTYFLLPPWKIRPYEASHVFAVNGNLYSEDGTSPFTQTLGNYNVTIINTVSNLVDSTIQQLPEIQYSAFQSKVTVDTINGVSGTDYPIGTVQYPVSNLADALSIANTRGLDAIQFLTDISLNGGSDLDNFHIIGKSYVDTNIYITNLAQTTGVHISDCVISGSIEGDVQISNAIIKDVSIISGNIDNCGLEGVLYFSGTENIVLNDCYTNNIINPPIIDLTGVPQNIAMPNYSGLITFRNIPDASIGVGLLAGQVILDSTVTGGFFIISGVGECINNSSGTTVNLDGLMSKSTIALAVYDVVGDEIQYAAFNGGVWIDASNGSTGTAYPLGTSFSPVNNLADAVSIANTRGFQKLYFLSDFTFPASTYISNFELIGQAANITTFTFDYGSICAYCTVTNATATGAQFGIIRYNTASLVNLAGAGVFSSDANIVAKECTIDGIILMPPNFTGSLTALDCWTRSLTTDYPIVDCSGAICSVYLRNYSGGVGFRNAPDDSDITIDMAAGRVILENTVTSQDIMIRGVGTLQNDSSGAIVNTDGFISKATIAAAVESEIGTEIQYGTFNGAVWVDACVGITGTAYPSGSQLAPVNNLTDAAAIAAGRGFSDIRFLTDFTFDASVNVADYTFIGEGKQKTIFTIESGATTLRCLVKSAYVTGYPKGLLGFSDCHVDTITGQGAASSTVTLIIEHSIIQGKITLPTGYGGQFEILDSWAMPDSLGVPPSFDMNNNEMSLQIRNLSGFLSVENVTQNSDVRIFLNSGGIELKPSVTNGTFRFAGIGNLINNSSSTNSIDTDSLISKDIIASAVYDVVGTEIEYTAFANVVVIDVINGSTGTAYPLGTALVPVNNLADAKTIAAFRGFDTLYLASDLTITTGEDISNLTISSDSWLNLTLEEDTSCLDTTFEKVALYGPVSGVWNVFNDCWLYDVSNFSGWMRQGSFSYISLAEGLGLEYGGESFFDNTAPLLAGGTSVLTMNASTLVSFTSANGDYEIRNSIAGCELTMELAAGRVTVDSTCTGGDMIIRGVGEVINNSSLNINEEGLMSKDTVSQAVWDEPLADHVTAGTTGRAMSLVEFSGRVWLDPCTGTAGTVFPTGTQAYPVNNGPDALQIAIREGLSEFVIQGTFTTTTNLADYTIGGDTWLDDGLIFNGNVYDTITFRDLYLSGVATFTDTEFKTCYIENINGISGELFNCRLKGLIQIEPGQTLSGVEIVVEGDFTTIDFQSTPGTTFSCDINSGYILVKNMVAGCLFEVNLKGGEVELDNSITGGDFYAEGVGTLFGDPSALGMNVLANHLVALETIPPYVWNEDITTITDPSTAGYSLWNMPKKVVSKILPFLFAK